MMVSSEAIKGWRKRTKERIIESMGGRCQCCGYNKCAEAFDLHHIDPSTKKISFGTIRRNPKSWKTIVEELRKCILLCSNCHREIHACNISLPETFQKFDEKYSDYKEFEGRRDDSKEMDACPICNILKPIRQKTCSRSCAGRRSSKQIKKVDWESVDLLRWKSAGLTNIKIAGILNISETAVRKRYKKILASSSVGSKRLPVKQKVVGSIPT